MFIIQDNVTEQQLAHYSPNPDDHDWDSIILGDTRDGATVFSKVHVFSTRLEAELAKKHLEQIFIAHSGEKVELDFAILKVEQVRGYKLLP